MTLILPRRRFLTTALGLLAAPAIVRASSLMPVRPVDLTYGTPIDVPPPFRIWIGDELIWEAPAKLTDLQLARAS